MKEQQLAPAEQAIEEVYRALLKMPRTMFVSLTTASLVPMLGPPETVRLLARASYWEGDVALARGKTRKAAACRRRARELYEAVGQGEDPDDAAALEALR